MLAKLLLKFPLFFSLLKLKQMETRWSLWAGPAPGHLGVGGIAAL